MNDKMSVEDEMEISAFDKTPKSFTEQTNPKSNQN